MEIGDLVKVKECPDIRESPIDALSDTACACFFCHTNSNRVGFVTAVAPRNAFHVMFDTGMWRLDMSDEARGDVEVIRASR